jgi:hypothetical protein
MKIAAKATANYSTYGVLYSSTNSLPKWLAFA